MEVNKIMSDYKPIGSVILEEVCECKNIQIVDEASTNEDVIPINGSRKSKKIVAEGNLQDMDHENRNRRIYAKADLAPEVTGPRIKELIKHGYMLGEAGHPLSDDLIRQQTIDPKLVGVRYHKIWVENEFVRGQFSGTNNEYGETFDMDLREGFTPSFSLRALGSIENIGGKAYVKGIKVITWDWVVYPSHMKSYTDKIVSEGAALVEKLPPSMRLADKDGKIHENTFIVPDNDPGTIITITGNDAKAALDRLQKESANVTTIVETFEGLYDRIDLVNEYTLKMTSRYGETINVNLENHVGNIIRDYAFKM